MQRLKAFLFCLLWIPVCLSASLHPSGRYSDISSDSCSLHVRDLHKMQAEYVLECGRLEHWEELAERASLFSFEATGAMTWDEALQFSETVHALAYAASNRLPQGGLFSEFMDKLLQHKVTERIPPLVYSNYKIVREIPSHLLFALPACNVSQKKELIKAVKKIIEFDRLYQSQATISQHINTDYIYNVLPHLFACALHQPDERQAVRDMKAFSYYLSACTQYTPGGMDGLKIDGTGFHHRTHYNGYMYAYKTWVAYMNRLKGTVFRVDNDGYQRMKQAVVSEYLMANLPQGGDGHYFANSLAGRHPFAGLHVDFGAELFRDLVEIGGDIKGEKIDEDLAAYYNAFFQSDYYKGIPPRRLTGFYQFNYSPAGIYRYGNWVATMRCPTTRFWGGEIYNKTNRFGRYQSHGSLEILYDGPLRKSGYPDGWERFSGKRGGWNWNIVPGTTTVHYTDWKELMPNGNNADRFDQWAKTTNFSGALSWGDCGMFASSFDQGDHWGGRRFEPTNLSFCKSVFAFDGILLSLGSGISSSGHYNENCITATNLFQELEYKENGICIINGKPLEKGSSMTLDADKDNWLVTSCSTGYLIPAGNDPVLLSYDAQYTPGPEGITDSSFASLYAAKAYINHGIKPARKQYCFAVIPAATPKEMAAYSHKLFDKRKGIFDIRQHQDSLHVVRHLPSRTLAYALFAPASSLHEGFLCSADTPLLLMERLSPKADVLEIAVCSPDLKPQNQKGSKEWIATSTRTTLVLSGNWKPINTEDNGILSYSNEKETTRLVLELKEGLSLYLRLTSEPH